MTNTEKLFLQVPTGLLQEESLHLADLALYIHLLLHPGCSISELSKMTGQARSTVRIQSKRLADSGWIVVLTQGSKKAMYPTISDEYQVQIAELYKEQIRYVARVGQTHMHEWLKILLDVPEILENARPWFLQNPETGEYMEYDCYLPEPYNVAWEFQGQQHFRTTDIFPDDEALRRLQMRDLIKVSLSKKHGIELMIVTEEDLNYKGMLAKIPPGIPLRYVDPNGPRVRSLESLCQEYTANIKRTIARQTRRNRQQSGKPAISEPIIRHHG